MERIGTQGVQLVISIILARLLAPEEFGLIALVMVIIVIADVFVQSGLGTALIRKKILTTKIFPLFFGQAFLLQLPYTLSFLQHLR